jgi:hypothetical protein
MALRYVERKFDEGVAPTVLDAVTQPRQRLGPRP